MGERLAAPSAAQLPAVLVARLGSVELEVAPVVRVVRVEQAVPTSVVLLVLAAKVERPVSRPVKVASALHIVCVTKETSSSGRVL